MTDIFGWVMAVANVILICLIYAQFRRQKKPIVTTKIISAETMARNGAGAKPNILEAGEVRYLFVSNISNNVASDVKIDYEFLLDGEKLAQVSEKLDYLNPNEATRMIIKRGEIIENHPDLFEEITRGRKTLTIPKKTIKLLLNIHVSYNPILGKLSPHKIKDSYEITWHSLENYQRFEDHPAISCLNKRGDLYIEKLTAKQEDRNESK